MKRILLRKRKNLFNSPRAKPPSSPRVTFQIRRLGALFFSLFLFSTLLVRFVWLQVVEYSKYRTMADQNRIALIPIVPPRGIIVDRHGIVLAHNYAAYTIEIMPAKITDLDNTLRLLEHIINISPKDRRRFKKLVEESKYFESIPIRHHLSDEEVARFAANSYRFPGVEVKTRLLRHYPLGEVASHLIGYIGRINTRDREVLERLGVQSNYYGTEHIGKVGLEQNYEQYLHGITGYREVEIDSAGRAIRILHESPPIPGKNLILSIDIKLQEIAENAFSNHNGALVAIHPKTGEILALVSKPGFDPNLFVDGIDPDQWKDLNTSPNKPLLNRAVLGEYPPGSTFKPFMALAALEGQFRHASTTINDPGFYQLGNHIFRDQKAGGHGQVDMYKSIVVSCDTYYYSLAREMGIDYISEFMRSLGLGQRTGIDIGEERPGILPSQEWKMKRFKRKWLLGETISIGIGQGYNAYTPLQMAHITATLANGGMVYKPHLVHSIEDAQLSKKHLIKPTLIRALSWKPSNVGVVLRAMVGVNREGTGAPAFTGASYTSGGKTGTAQVFSLKGAKYKESTLKKHLHDHAWFIAFAPAKDPQIALAVLVEHGGFGSRTAAPIARQVLDYYLLSKKPSQPHSRAEVEDD